MLILLLLCLTLGDRIEKHREWSKEELLAGSAQLKTYLGKAHEIGTSLRLRPESSGRAVVLIPGIAGSRIQYNYENAAAPGIFCKVFFFAFVFFIVFFFFLI
jgi:hypothetical protein